MLVLKSKKSLRIINHKITSVWSVNHKVLLNFSIIFCSTIWIRVLEREIATSRDQKQQNDNLIKQSNTQNTYNNSWLFKKIATSLDNAIHCDVPTWSRD